MQNHFFLFLLFFSFSGSLFSQDINSQIDLIAKKADSIRIIDPNMALKFIEDLDSLLSLYPDDKFQIRSYTMRSKTLKSLGDDEAAKIYTEKVLALASPIKDTISLLNGYSGLASYYAKKMIYPLLNLIMKK